MIPAWSDWPAVDRQAGAEMDGPFFQKWNGRDLALSVRPIPGHPENVSAHAFAGGSLETMAEDRLWLPPYANRLDVYFDVRVLLTDSSGTLGGGASFSVELEGATVSETFFVGSLLLACKIDFGPPATCDGPRFDADGVPSDSGTWFARSATFEIPDGLVGEELDYRLKAERTNSNTASAGMRPSSAGVPWLIYREV